MFYEAYKYLHTLNMESSTLMFFNIHFTIQWLFSWKWPSRKYILVNIQRSYSALSEHKALQCLG